MTVKIPYPPRIELARLPTPLEPIPNLSDDLGVEVYIKRDDLTGMALSGNKVRKLEFVMAEALSRGADTVITAGGAQSNHARATAVAAARLGLESLLVLAVSDPSHPPPSHGNILLDRMVGARILWVSFDEFNHLDDIFEREAQALSARGKKPYLIPIGASNALGAWGYIQTAEELGRDLDDLKGGREVETTIVHAAGSGGTAAGLILGSALTGLNARVVSFSVSGSRDRLTDTIGTICEQALEMFAFDVPFSREIDIKVIDDYVGRGYALSRPEELAFIRDLARSEGVLLDPVYTGKAFYGMVQEIKADSTVFGRRVVFVHTGGLFGLLAKVDEIEPLL